jgi:segregation and condensation protein A
MVFFSVQNALERLQRMVGSKPDWSSLDAFLPQGLGEGLPRRAALSATLIAGLEMTKGGRLELKQDQTFGPIMLRPIERDETATDLEDEDGRD